MINELSIFLLATNVDGKTFHFRIFAQSSHANTEVNYFFVESIRFAF